MVISCNGCWEGKTSKNGSMEWVENHSLGGGGEASDGCHRNGDIEPGGGHTPLIPTLGATEAHRVL